MSAVCAVCLLLCNFHRSVFTALLPALAGAGGGGLALSGGEVGLLQGAMLVGYLAGQLPAGEASDREGGDRWAGWAGGRDGCTGVRDGCTCVRGWGVGRDGVELAPWARLGVAPCVGNGLVVATVTQITESQATLMLQAAVSPYCFRPRRPSPAPTSLAGGCHRFQGTFTFHNVPCPTCLLRRYDDRRTLVGKADVTN